MSRIPPIRREPLPSRDDLLAGRTELRVSEHALREAHKEGLRGKDITVLAKVVSLGVGRQKPFGQWRRLRQEGPDSGIRPPMWVIHQF